MLRVVAMAVVIMAVVVMVVMVMAVVVVPIVVVAVVVVAVVVAAFVIIAIVSMAMSWEAGMVKAGRKFVAGEVIRVARSAWKRPAAFALAAAIRVWARRVLTRRVWT